MLACFSHSPASREEIENSKNCGASIFNMLEKSETNGNQERMTSDF